MTNIIYLGQPRYQIERPVMTQQWQQLTYLHWPVAPAAVSALLPPGLDVDTFGGTAWVGLVPFRMVDIAFSDTPAIPYFGTFPETNVRTYVTGPQGPGVWFHSLDITRVLPVAVARLTYRLPYMWGAMAIERNGDRITYTARRRWPRVGSPASAVTVDIGPKIEEPSPFEHFVSARWGLYTMLGSRLAFGRVEHEPWPLYEATPVAVEDDFVAAAGYSQPVGEPHAMYSPGVSVRIDRPRFVA